MGAEAEAGVVDQGVQLGVVGEDSVGELVDLVERREVGDDGVDRCSIARFLDLPTDRGHLVRITTVQDDRGPELRETPGQCVTQPAGGGGDENRPLLYGDHPPIVPATHHAVSREAHVCSFFGMRGHPPTSSSSLGS